MAAAKTQALTPEASGSDTEVVPHFIGGKTVKGTSGRFGNVYNPALGKVARKVEFANKTEVDSAVQAAAAAFPDWSVLPPLRRARILNRFLGLLEKNLDRAARIIVSEHGKVISDARGEMQRGMEVVEFATGIPQLLKGEFSESVGTGVDSYSIRQPLGVVAGITPFNFPAMVPMWMFSHRFGMRQYLRSEAKRARSVAFNRAGVAAERGGPSRRRLQCRPGG